jgi:hypothetical protein
VSLQTGPATVSELGLELKHSPTLTELRLPSRLGWGPGCVLSCAGLIVVMMGTGIAAAAWFGPRDRLGFLVLIALLLVVLVYGL